MISAFFLKMAILVMAGFLKNAENHIHEFTLVIICMIFPENDKLGLKLKVLEFFENQPDPDSENKPSPTYNEIN